MSSRCLVRLLRPLLLAASVLFLLPACHGGIGPTGDLVGAPCRGDYDCVERCVDGGDFPGGTCTVKCRNDGDCPDGTWCIDKKGGVCLPACEFHTDCRAGYECDDKKREGHSGRRYVCIGD